MPIVRLNSEPFIDFIEGSPVVSFWFSDVGPLEDEIYEFIDLILDDKNCQEVGLDVRCKLSDLLNSCIDGHRLIKHGDSCIVVSKDEKPLFQAIKSDLLKLIDTIDSITYAEE